MLWKLHCEWSHCEKNWWWNFQFFEPLMLKKADLRLQTQTLPQTSHAMLKLHMQRGLVKEGGFWNHSHNPQWRVWGFS